MQTTTEAASANDKLLRTVLNPLVGLPFLFARASYGEELTLHFGEARPMKHPKLCHVLEGTYIVRTRDSGWVFSRDDSAVVMVAPGERPSADDFRARLVCFSEAQGATVTSADPSVVGKDGFEPAYALSVFLSDGWRVSIEPALERPRSEDEVADWEVFTPQGVLLAGPGLKIDWQPGSENQEGRGGAIDFDAAARVFESRVRSAKITPATEVILVYHCVDQSGRMLPDFRTDIAATTKARGNKLFAEALAAGLYLDSILGNINSLVRHAPRELILLADAPPVPRRIIGFDLEIINP